MPHRVIGCHHVTQNISRAGVTAVRHFYRDLLGLEEISSAQQDPTGQRLIWLAIGDKQLHLVIGDKPDFPTSRHLAVLVDGFDDMMVDLLGNDVKFDEQAPGQFWGTRPNGTKFAFCYDPDGNRIELMENQE